MTSLAERKIEVETKLRRLRERLATRQLDAALLNQISNTAWITAGAATYVNEASDGGPSSILVTHDKAYVLTDTVEAPRLDQEEHLSDLGFQLVVEPWHTRGTLSQPLMHGLRIGYDVGGAHPYLADDLRALRSVLMTEEIGRLRSISALAADAMNEAIRQVRPGDTEFKAASYLSAAARVRGGTAIVNLIASDERIRQFRHPLPTAKVIDQYAMLVLCLRISGLIVSITRLVYFGTLPDDLRNRAHAVAQVDAAMIAGTRAGRTMADMFALARDSYAAVGFPEAIDEHHQGGSAGYAGREVFTMPDDQTPIEYNQAFAWNPSVRGVKSEDTILLTEQGIEVLTVVDKWPVWNVTVGSETIARPAILEV